jgi:alpha-methylacyl-CoA racemase
VCEEAEETAAFFAEPLRYGITKPDAPLGGGFPGYGLFYEARSGWTAVATLERISGSGCYGS